MTIGVVHSIEQTQDLSRWVVAGPSVNIRALMVVCRIPEVRYTRDRQTSDRKIRGVWAGCRASSDLPKHIGTQSNLGSSL